MVMQAAVKPVEAPKPRETEPVPAAPAASRLTMPVILMINGVILLALVLILYFAFRSPPAAVQGAGGAAATADSTAARAGDSASTRRDSTAP
jgi:hypothetical protein